MDLETLTDKIVRKAIKVHKNLGPGLLHSAYRKCLAYELRKEGLIVKCEVSIPIIYEDIEIDTSFRADMIVENCAIIESRLVDKLTSTDEAQLYTYLKLSNLQLGFLLNWNVTSMIEGINIKQKVYNPAKFH